MYDDELIHYQEDAEERYDDYHSFDDDDDEFLPEFEEADGIYDDDYEEEIEYITEPDYTDDDMYDNYRRKTTSPFGKIDPNDRTLTFVIKNTTDNDAEAILFGANAAESQKNGVSVDVAESSHQIVRNESFSNPFQITGMKMSVSDPLQFDNVLKITKQTATGSVTERVFQPRTGTSPQNFSQQLIDLPSWEMTVGPQDALRFLVRAKAEVVFTFTIAARVNMRNLLKGKNVAEISRTPRPTGLPTWDMQTTKKSAVFGIRRGKPKMRKVIRRKPLIQNKRRVVKRTPPRHYLKRRKYS